MLNRKNLFALFCILSLLLAGAVFSMPDHASGQMTIPTRTPVPDGGDPDPEPEPTDDNGGGGGGGGGDNQPEPTDEPDPEPEPTDKPQPLPPSPAPTRSSATAVPTAGAGTETPAPLISATPPATVPAASPSATLVAATATPAATVTAEIIVPPDEIVAFPANSQPFPQAGQCGMPPTFTSLNAISVYAGPGEDYQLVGLLGATEVRPIVGRAAFTHWWVVQLDPSGRVGWVTDGSGTIQGFTGRVPIISAPDLNGVAPAPGGPAWLPTPDANCNAPELLAAVVASKTSTGGAEAPPSGKPDSVAGLPDYNENAIASAPDGEETVVIRSDGASDEVSTGVVRTGRQAAAEPLINELADTAAPLELPAPASPQLPNLMPVVGVVLILAAVFIGLAAKRNRSGSNE